MVALKTLTVLLSALGYMGFIGVFGRVRASATPVLALSAIVLVLYGFGLAGVLFPGAVVALLGGLGLGAAALVGVRRRWREILAPRQAVCLLYLLPFVLFYRAIPVDFLFTGWDEFSFWAPSAKLLYEIDGLYQAASPIVFKNYPPGQQLLQYFLTSLTRWSEKSVLFAQVAFMLSAILAVTGSFTRQRSVLGVTAFYSACAFIYFFRYDYAHIFADQLLAVYFAAAIALAIRLENRYRHLAWLPAMLAVLVLTKQVGLLLALVALGCYVLARGFEAAALTGTWRVRLRACLPALLTTLLGLLAILLAYRSWNAYVASINASKDLTLPALESFFQAPMLQRMGTTFLEFLSRLHVPNFMVLHERAGPPLSLYGLTVCLLLASVVVALVQPRGQRARALALLAFLFLCALGYVAFLLLSYLVFFTEYEGTQLASFERYAATYHLAWLLVLFGLFCGRIDHLRARAPAWVLAAVVAGVTAYAVPSAFLSDLQAVQADPLLLQKRQKVDALVDVMKKHMSGYDRAYFISQRSSGYEKYAFNYAVQPFHSMWWCWSVGAPYDDKDVWSCDDPLTKLLQPYAYVAIFHADERFWKDNGAFFDPEVRGRESGVFRVDRQGDAVVHLTEVH